MSRLESIFNCAVRTFCRTFRLTVLEYASVRVGSKMTAKRLTSALQPSNSSTRFWLLVCLVSEESGKWLRPG